MTKILIIEDLPDNREMTALILRNHGYEVSVAENGERGLSLAKETKPDLIIYGYWLPDIDARSFLARLRSTDGIDKTRVVVCTATPEESVRRFVGEQGFDGMIAKPFRLQGFLDAIESHVTA